MLTELTSILDFGFWNNERLLWLHTPPPPPLSFLWWCPEFWFLKKRGFALPATPPPPRMFMLIELTSILDFEITSVPWTLTISLMDSEQRRQNASWPNLNSTKYNTELCLLLSRENNYEESLALRLFTAVLKNISLVQFDQNNDQFPTKMTYIRVISASIHFTLCSREYQSREKWIRMNLIDSFGVCEKFTRVDFTELLIVSTCRL